MRKSQCTKWSKKYGTKFVLLFHLFLHVELLFQACCITWIFTICINFGGILTLSWELLKHNLGNSTKPESKHCRGVDINK